MTAPKAKAACFGIEFEVTEQWKFHVLSLEKTWDTYAEMRAGIEAAQKAIAASKREKLSLPVINTTDGKEFVITGIHAGHGSLVTIPKKERFGPRIELVPREPWLLSAIAEMHQLRERADKIDSVIDEFQIQEPDRFNVADHANHVAALRKKFDEMTAKAKKTTLEKELAKLKEDKPIRY